MLTVVNDQNHSNIPTHSMLAQRMLDRIEQKIRLLFHDQKKLIEDFEAGHYTRCLATLNEIINDFKGHRRLSTKTRKEREELFKELHSWITKHSRHIKSSANTFATK